MVASAEPPQLTKMTANHPRSVRRFSSANLVNRRGSTQTETNKCSISTIAGDDSSIVRSLRNGASTAHNIAAKVTRIGPIVSLERVFSVLHLFIRDANRTVPTSGGK